MMRFMKNLAFLALLCLGFAAQAQTTSFCDKANNNDCVDVPTAEMTDLMYGFDAYVKTLTLPLLTPTFAVCDKGNPADCRNVPTDLSNNFFHGFEMYILHRAEDVATTVVAAADTMSETETQSLLAGILADYSTTAETEAIAEAAAADAVDGYVTTGMLDDYATEAEAADIAEGVTNTALTDYSTTAETQTIADEAAADALEGYATEAQLEGYVTEVEMGSYVTAPEAEDIAEGVTTTALADYTTTAEAEAIAENAAALAAEFKADLNQVGIIATGVVEEALLDYSTSAQVQDMIDTAVANALAGYTPPVGPGEAKGWFSFANSTTHSYNMTRLNANQYRLNLTIASGKRIIPVVTSNEESDDCHAPSFTTSSSGQPVINVTCKVSHSATATSTPGELTLVVFTSN